MFLIILRAGIESVFSLSALASRVETRRRKKKPINEPTNRRTGLWEFRQICIESYRAHLTSCCACLTRLTYDVRFNRSLPHAAVARRAMKRFFIRAVSVSSNIWQQTFTDLYLHVLCSTYCSCVQVCRQHPYACRDMQASVLLNNDRWILGARFSSLHDCSVTFLHLRTLKHHSRMQSKAKGGMDTARISKSLMFSVNHGIQIISVHVTTSKLINYGVRTHPPSTST